MDFFNNTNIVLLTALLFCLIVQMVYYWVYLFKPYKYQKGQEKIGNHESVFFPVSVVIVGRNEALRLEKFLPVILEQDYPQYEVIFVNDASTDNTEDVLKRIASKYNHFYHTYIPAGSKNLSRKKLALTMGIKAAKYDALLFTEPDCFPVSNAWITMMASKFSVKKKIVLGLTFFEHSPKYIAYDYFFSNLQMFSLALFRRPYTGNGRNLIYSKNYFEERKGFTQSNFLDIGEDDLFINQIATRENVEVELSNESHIIIDPDNSDYWKELKIHKNVTQRFYKKFSVYFWRGEKISRVIYYILFFVSLIYSILTIQWILFGIVVFTFLLRLFSLLFVINKTATLLEKPKYYFSLPLFDLIQPFIDVYFSFVASLKARNNYNWKYEKR